MLSLLNTTFQGEIPKIKLSLPGQNEICLVMYAVPWKCVTRPYMFLFPFFLVYLTVHVDSTNFGCLPLSFAQLFSPRFLVSCLCFNFKCCHQAGTGKCSCGGKMIQGLCVKPTKGDAVLFWSMVSIFTCYKPFRWNFWRKIHLWNPLKYFENVGLVALRF